MILDLRFPPINIAAVFFFQFESQILPEEFHVLNHGQDMSMSGMCGQDFMAFQLVIVQIFLVCTVMAHSPKSS